jgi:hypothetical protein
MNKQMLSSILRSPQIQRLCNTSAIAMFISILLIGSLPSARQDIGQYASGVVLHSVAYAMLGVLTFIGGHGSAVKRALWCVLKVAAMGAIDERVQSFFPYRTAAVGDWLVDVTAGVVISVVLLKLWPILTSQTRADGGI